MTMTIYWLKYQKKLYLPMQPLAKWLVMLIYVYNRLTYCLCISGMYLNVSKVLVFRWAIFCNFAFCLSKYIWWMCTCSNRHLCQKCNFVWLLMAHTLIQLKGDAKLNENSSISNVMLNTRNNIHTTWTI